MEVLNQIIISSKLTEFFCQNFPLNVWWNTQHFSIMQDSGV